MRLRVNPLLLLLLLLAVALPASLRAQSSRPTMPWDTTACWRLTVDTSFPHPELLVAPLRPGMMSEWHGGGWLGRSEARRSELSNTYERVTWGVLAPDTLLLVSYADRTTFFWKLHLLAGAFSGVRIDARHRRGSFQRVYPWGDTVFADKVDTVRTVPAHAETLPACVFRPPRTDAGPFTYP